MPNDRIESNPYIRSRTQRKEEDDGKCHVDNEKWKCNQANGPQSKEERLNSAQSESRLFMKAAQTSSRKMFQLSFVLSALLAGLFYAILLTGVGKTEK